MKTQCPYCREIYEAADSVAGSQKECFKCGKRFVVYSIEDSGADSTCAGLHPISEAPFSAESDLDRTVVGARGRKAKGDLREGDIILNRYEVLRKLGSGAMGMVLLCRDQVSKEDFALKMVPPELARDEEAMENIRENFRLVHGLKHPNIASMDFLERDEYGRYFLLMEFAQGRSFASWRRELGGKIPLEKLIPVVKQIASALDYSHSKSVLHRDVKPANVMVSETGEVKVLDFGLASRVRSSMTNPSINPANTSGTPNYMPPESFKAQYPRPASDQYSLAVMVYEALAGHLPFDSDNFEMLRSAVERVSPEPVDGLPPATNSALQKAMAKDPKARFANCIEFADALQGSRNATEQQEVKQEGNLQEDLRRQAQGKVAKEQELKRLAEEKKKIEAKEEEILTRASASELGKEWLVTLPGNVSMELIKVEAGSFTMSKGDGENFSNEKEHRATITRDFYLGKTEVTQGQWKAIMGTNPSLFKNGDNYPVERVTWNEAMSFCEKLNKLTVRPAGYKFSLPTETQWEYAAVGGKKSCGYKYSGSNNLNEIGWYVDNSGNYTHPVGTKQANELGIYDMSGNVWEWCLDDYSYDSSKARPEFTRGNERGGFIGRTIEFFSGSVRVGRGGSWFSLARGCRSASRGYGSPGYRDYDLGFRVALVPEKY